LPDDRLDVIFSNLDRETLLAELKPQRKGGYLLLDCPFCKKHEAYLYDNSKVIACNRLEKCGRKVSIWDYVQERDGLTQQETLLKLAAEAGVHLEPMTEEATRKMKARADERDMLEALQGHFRDLLFTPAATEALQYLKKRGYSEEDIKGMELGFFPGYGEAFRWLDAQGYGNIASIACQGGALRYMKSRSEYKITFLWRDQYGRPLSLWGRLAREPREDDKGKYLPFGEGGKGVPLRLDKARGLDSLVLVEGPFDALLAGARGLEGVVALGSAVMSAEQEAVIKSLKLASITLALDNDEAGAQGTEAIIPKLQAGGHRVYVADLPPQAKDPDALIARHGAEAFKAVLEDAEPAGVWLVRRILKRHNLKTAQGKGAALDEIMRYTATLRPTEEAEATKDLAFVLGVSEEALSRERTLYQQEQARERFLEQARKQWEDIARTARENPEEALKEAEETLSRLKTEARAAAGIGLPEPYTMPDLLRDLEKTQDGLKTGYKDLDRYLHIPRGAISIIAGRPGHGKTTFLLNLALNMARQNPDKKFYFFSYEEAERWLAVKLLMMACGHVFNKQKNLAAYIEYLKGLYPGGREFVIEEAREEVGELLSSGRITLVYRNAPADEVADMIRAFADRENMGAVFLDYIQKVPAMPQDNGRFTAAYQKIQAASETLRDAAVNADIPLIMGAQFRRTDKIDKKGVLRLDNLRESGDIEQDANVVLGMYNKAAADLEETLNTPGVEFTTPEQVDINVAILKNRGGAAGKEITLSFRPQVLQINDH